MAAKYLVAYPFTAFQRDYKKGHELTQADIDCWFPEEQREAVIHGLLRMGRIIPLDLPPAAVEETEQ